MKQLKLPLSSDLPADVYKFGARSSGETHGVVLTKPHIVELILDLAGYTVGRDLGSIPLLEPACGKGAFLRPAVRRLIQSAARRKRRIADLRSAIAAYDIDSDHVESSREVVRHELVEGGATIAMARSLASHWVREGDFLLGEEEPRFGAVVGNPPYVRIEQIAPALQAEYRERYTSIYDRADLYVAFIERGLALLRDDGILSYVCADRWTLNKYGAPLRRFISKRFRVRTYVDLHLASPFESDVIAYPAIFSISRGESKAVDVAKLQSGSKRECSDLQDVMLDPSLLRPGVRLDRYSTWFEGDDPWTLTSPDHLAVLRDLEARHPLIEADGATRIRIGVATGNDSVYIVDRDADIEPDRLVPLVMREDIAAGTIRDARRCVINAFDDDGAIIDLARHPRLARYLACNARSVRARHVAKSNPRAWFRTIDRVYPELVKRPKLLIPDIAGSNEVAFDEGRFHPHHNLYYVTSGVWDLELLGAILSSRVALFFIWTYAVKMRGGYLRFQAQYLRRIRIPRQEAISARVSRALVAAFRRRDFGTIDELAPAAYGLSVLPDFPFTDTRR